MPFFIPRTVHLPTTALPAAGAFTAQAFFPLPRGVREISYWITYTRDPAGADTGNPKFLVQWGNGVEEAFELVLDRGSLVVAQPAGDFNMYIEEPLGPIPGSDAPITYVLPVVAPYGASLARLLVAEQGDVANPGTILVALTGGVGAP